MKCERSMTRLSGATLHMTAWQIPTHSLSSPKSVMKTIERTTAGA